MRPALLSLSLAVASLFAQFGPSGPGATFLTIIPDARTSALGGAGVALDDLDANTYYNPAYLTFGPRAAATWTHVHWLPGYYWGASYDHVGLAVRVGERFGIAASLLYLQTGLWEVHNERGELIGTFRTYDMTTSLSAAYCILPSLSAGVTAKVIYSLVYPEWAWPQAKENWDALTLAGDAGIQYRPLDALTLGLAVANLGPNISYDTTDGAYLPRIARFGVAINPLIPGPVSVTVTGQVSQDLFPAVAYQDPWHAGAGLELGFSRLAFIRLGYLHYDSDGSKGLTWGVGLQHRNIKFDVGVDSNLYPEPPTTRNVRFQFSWHL